MILLTSNSCGYRRSQCYLQRTNALVFSRNRQCTNHTPNWSRNVFRKLLQCSLRGKFSRSRSVRYFCGNMLRKPHIWAIRVYATIGHVLWQPCCIVTASQTSDVVWDRRSYDKTGLRPKKNRFLVLVLQVWCCMVKHGRHARRHNDLEGHSNFSSTIYSFFSIPC